MAYRIEYGRVRRGKRWFFRKKSILIGLCILLLLSLLSSRVRMGVRDAILPGNDAVTADALGTLVTDLTEGENLTEAVSAFCVTIITESAS